MVKELEEMKTVTPTKTQAEAIPFLQTNGGDLIAQTRNGTDKTAANGPPVRRSDTPSWPDSF